MSLFSGIVNSIRETISSISDTTFNLMGNVTDLFSRGEKTSYPVGGLDVSGGYGYDPDDMGSLYDDYIDWVGLGFDS